jgi:hypothetical protein
MSNAPVSSSFVILQQKPPAMRIFLNIMVMLMLLPWSAATAQVMRGFTTELYQNQSLPEMYATHPVFPSYDSLFTQYYNYLPDNYPAAQSSDSFYHHSFRWEEGEKPSFIMAPMLHLSSGSSHQGDLSFDSEIGLKTFFRPGQVFYSGLTYTWKFRRSFEYLNEYQETHRVLPGEGLYSQQPYDQFQGFLGVRLSAHFRLETGFDKHFIGKGERSLFLSDVGYAYPYLKLDARVSSIRYISLWMQLRDVQNKALKNWYDFPAKYVSLHYLSWKISQVVRIGFFEAIIWQDEDADGRRGFEINYLNPVIFFRPVEFTLGSPDNAMMGFDMDVTWKNNLVYMQLVLDEFKLEEMKAMDGWWANKQAFQLGLRKFNLFGIENLHAFAEYNYVRPFMYSHFSVLQSYGHFNQPLAHPLGANLMEGLAGITWSKGIWFLRFKANYAIYGTNFPDTNFGGDIFLDYDSHTREYGNVVGQGNTNRLVDVVLYGSRLLNPSVNLRLFGRLACRHHHDEVRPVNNHVFLQLGITTRLKNNWTDF